MSLWFKIDLKESLFPKSILKAIFTIQDFKLIYCVKEIFIHWKGSLWGWGIELSYDILSVLYVLMIHPWRGHHWEIRPGRWGQFCPRAEGPRAELALSEGLFSQWGPSQGCVIINLCTIVVKKGLFYYTVAKFHRASLGNYNYARSLILYQLCPGRKIEFLHLDWST